MPKYDNMNPLLFLLRTSLAMILSAALLPVAFADGAQQSKTPETPKPQGPPQSGGASTGGTFAPVLDEKHRPITAGGFVDGAPVVFVDDTKKSGLDKFKHVSGTPEKNLILEAPGSGVAIFDYDNDGWPDIYLVNGSTFDALRGKEKPPRAALYHNNHDGTFTDVTEKAGVANERWGFGVAVGDFDNDGWPDLYVTNYGKNRLYHNNHDGTFTDVAEKAGVAVSGAQPAWSTGATFGDFDGDGKLDLYVTGYVKFDLNNPPIAGTAATQYSFCQYRGKPVMCGPRGLPGEHNHLFHNNGDGTFTEVSQKAGVANEKGYYGFGVAFADVNDDGKLDLVVANDSVPNYLFLNKGDGTFEDASYPSGFALKDDGREQAAMGLGIGDYDNSGHLSLYVTTFSDDYFTLYKNEGDANFSDVSFLAGVAAVTIPFLGWGTGFLDFDNDGWKDIFDANGHVYPGVDQNDWGMTYAQRPLLFHNLDGRHFQVVPPATSSGLAVVVSARGAAFGDLFNDGKTDVVLNTIDGPPVLLRNVVSNGNNWVDLKLTGGPKSPRDAIGAKAFLTANGMTQRNDVISGGSYISNNDMRLHFGIGKAKQVDKLEIRWPDGTKDNVALPGINRVFSIVEGKGVSSEQPK
jgi:enediyne biosynthesis protein E4